MRAMPRASRAVIPVVDRVLAKSSYDGGCWVYNGNRTDFGYGMVSRPHGQTPTYAHRAVYEALVGPIPKGMHIDHLCRNPSCCNPLHLEVVTVQENVLRGKKRALPTHCPQGHEYTAGNKKGGRFVCRACSIIRTKAWQDRKKRVN